MKKAAIIAVIAFVPLSMSAKQDVSSAANPLVSLHEASTDLSPHGTIASSCISVRSDGHFHLELRRQQLPKPTATVNIYEASLNNFQLERLKSLLDSQSVKDLGPYAPPVLPAGLTAFAVFGARVARGDRIQHAGYFVWDMRQGKFDQSIPDSSKEQWRIAQTVLVPLVQWFHEIEGQKWPEAPGSPESSSNFCDIDSPATN